MYGNIVSAIRGETVPSEFLEAGNGAVENQQLTLKKKLLTYSPSSTAAD